MHEKALSLNPHLHELFVKRPKFIMDNCDNFNKALKVTQFIINNPHSNLYIREVDLEGINTKFIENNRELILYLYAYATNKEQEISLKSDKESFNLTCGFRSKRPIVRFSFIGDDCSPLVNLSPRMDISLDIESFSNLNPKVKNVIICENEITFLSLPKCQDTMAIFGGGYNAKILGVVYWLNFKNIYYWGDLDRDGFAILNNLRANLPNAKIISLMMDKETFNLGRVSAVEDTSKTAGDLLYLTPKENELYNARLDAANDYSEKYIQAQMEMHQTLSDLHQQYLDGEFESEEAYNNAVTAAKEYYYELLEQYQDIYHNIFADNSTWINDFMSGESDSLHHTVTTNAVLMADSIIGQSGLATEQWSKNFDAQDVRT